jgi:thiamine-phosphate pyrophosphorylase
VTAPLELTLVTDRRLLPAGRDVAALAAEAAAAGVDRVQVREKDLPDRALGALVASVAAALAGSATELVVNGRPDFAELAGASGVQVPEGGLPIAGVRRAFPRLHIGASCHSVEAAVRAAGDGADWIVLGPVFATPGKEARALGLAVLAETAARVPIPVHAVGGVGPGNAAEAAAAGARGILAIRAFTERPVAAAVAAFRGLRR